MKIKFSGRRGFTVLELFVVIVVLVILVAILIPPKSKSMVRARRIACLNNQKQIGVGFLLWANDHNDKFPMEVSTNEGGSMEFTNAADTFRHFQVASSEISSEKVLVCRADVRNAATNFESLSNSNLSYFIGLDANLTNTNLLLTGDRNLTLNRENLGSGIYQIKTNNAVDWSEKEIHKGAGNIGLTDGSVQQVTSGKLRDQIKVAGEIQRLSLP